MTRTLLLFGAGPGIGNHVAATLASSGGLTHVILLGRNSERLTREDAPFVLKAAPDAKVDVLRADLGDVDSIPGVLKQLDELTKGEDIEVVYYNAARIQPTDPVLDVGVREIEEDLRVRRPHHHHHHCSLTPSPVHTDPTHHIPIVSAPS